VKVVFCGGCNPQIDRGALVEELRRDAILAQSDATVYVSGCARSCASGQALTVSDGGIVVAGECLDGTPTSATDLAAEIKRKLQGVADGLES
jgi:hypothetical protein